MQVIWVKIFIPLHPSGFHVKNAMLLENSCADARTVVLCEEFVAPSYAPMLLHLFQGEILSHKDVEKL